MYIFPSFSIHLQIKKSQFPDRNHGIKLLSQLPEANDSNHSHQVWGGRALFGWVRGPFHLVQIGWFLEFPHVMGAPNFWFWYKKCSRIPELIFEAIWLRIASFFNGWKLGPGVAGLPLSGRSLRSWCRLKERGLGMDSIKIRPWKITEETRKCLGSFWLLESFSVWCDKLWTWLSEINWNRFSLLLGDVWCPGAALRPTWPAKKRPGRNSQWKTGRFQQLRCEQLWLKSHDNRTPYGTNLWTFVDEGAWFCGWHSPVTFVMYCDSKKNPWVTCLSEAGPDIEIAAAEELISCVREQVMTDYLFGRGEWTHFIPSHEETMSNLRCALNALGENAEAKRISFSTWLTLSLSYGDPQIFRDGHFSLWTLEA